MWVWEGVWVGEAMEMVMEDMVGEMGDLGVGAEALEVVTMGEEVDIVVGEVEVEEEGAVLVGLKRFNQTTKYLYRVYQQMLQKGILHNFLGQ